VFDVHGRRVRTILDGEVSSGRHALVWDGRTLSGTEAPAGIYFVRLEGKDRDEVLRAVRIR
jgi:flagellar hook assembly protein FlgD